ncbi:MAG TPA: RDD family protein [Acidimicrobiales bacterium]
MSATTAATTRPRASRRYTPPRQAAAVTAKAKRAPKAEPTTAPAGRRTVAAVLDGAAVITLVLGGAELGWRTGALPALGVSAAGWVDWAWSFHRVAWTMAGVAVVYHGVCTALWQRTPGKRLAGLRIEAETGGPLTPGRALWRGLWSATTFIPSVVTPLVVTGGWLASARGGRRSLADRAAGSRVVRARGKGP